MSLAPLLWVLRQNQLRLASSQLRFLALTKRLLNIHKNGKSVEGMYACLHLSMIDSLNTGDKVMVSLPSLSKTQIYIKGQSLNSDQKGVMLIRLCRCMIWGRCSNQVSMPHICKLPQRSAAREVLRCKIKDTFKKNCLLRWKGWLLMITRIFLQKMLHDV